MQGRAIDRLLKVAGNTRKIRKEVVIKGEEFSFWMTPLTIAEQKAAEKQSRSDDVTDTGIQLLIKKAKDENDLPLFTAADAPTLRNSIERIEVEKLLLALLVNEEEEQTPELDMKSADESASKGKRGAS
jgi:hypothetical protein